MQIDFHKSFKKNFVKLPPKIQSKFNERYLLFCENQLNPLLHYHPLTGKLAGFYSINVTGDYRAQFYYKSAEHIIFLRIGTHSQLYG